MENPYNGPSALMVKVETNKWLTELDGHTLTAGLILLDGFTLNLKVTFLLTKITSNLPKLATRWPHVRLDQIELRSIKSY